MKKREFMCMVFIFSSLFIYLLADTPAVLSLGKLCKEHGYICEWPGGREPRLAKKCEPYRTENFVPFIGSSRTITEFYHNFFLDFASAGSIYFHWNQHIREVTRKLQRTVAEELRQTATEKVFPNGWRTSQRTSRSQKYLHPQEILMTQIRNVLQRGITEALEQKSFSDLITADHKVVNEDCESRNNHRCAVVVQLATQLVATTPVSKKKTSQETEESLRKILEPSEKPKVHYTENSLEFGKCCEYLP